jgi:hypothetical protein
MKMSRTVVVILPVTERMKVQLRLEAFNVFNRPSFSNPGSSLGDADFGWITSTSTFNRQTQVAVKILF